MCMIHGETSSTSALRIERTYSPRCAVSPFSTSRSDLYPNLPHDDRTCSIYPSHPPPPLHLYPSSSPLLALLFPFPNLNLPSLVTNSPFPSGSRFVFQRSSQAAILYILLHSMRSSDSDGSVDGVIPRMPPSGLAHSDRKSKLESESCLVWAGNNRVPSSPRSQFTLTSPAAVAECQW